MAQQSADNSSRQRDVAVVLTRLFIEALNARDFLAARALVSEDAELRGPSRSSLRGFAAANELLEAAAHIGLVIVRTGTEDLSEDEGATRVTVPVRELVHRDELFRTAVFRIRDGAITSYETLGND